MCQPASTCRSQQFIFWRCVCRLASVCNAAWTVSYRHQHAMLTCVTDLYVYDSLQYDRRVLRGLKSWVWSHMTNNKKHKKTKTKKRQCQLSPVKVQDAERSPNGTLVLKHRCLASIVHSKLDYCNSLYYNLPKSQIFAYKVHSTSQPQYAIWSSQSVQPTCRIS